MAGPTTTTFSSRRNGSVVDVGNAELPPALQLLSRACQRSGGAVSVGLEPCEEYLPSGFEPDIPGYERFLRVVVEATSDVAAAYKFNLAFFEALGVPGIELLYRIRRSLPSDAYVIADAKRCDIGSSSRRYAQALYDSLEAHAATVNPLLGRDSVEPFLEYADRLCFILALTSNPGAADFLAADGLSRRIAAAVASWNSRGNCGLVVGATQPEMAAEVRKAAPGLPFLVPGIGAQGGDLERAARACLGKGQAPTVLFHVTRGVLPEKLEKGDVAEIICAKTVSWRKQVNDALNRERPQ